jgi:3-oxoacyl-[acyl-carrier-protein] synthase-3
VIRAWVGEYLRKVDEGRIAPEEVDHCLVHYSAKSLRTEIVSLLVDTAGMIPEEKWFSVLREQGNVGSASVWLMLDALMGSGRVKSGQKILCVVPESGRALVGFMMLEAV